MPYDELVKMPGGGHAFVRFSGRRPKPKPCAFCGQPSSKLCDMPLLHGKTCDKPLCEAHAVRQGPDVDWCPDHGNATDHQENA